MKKSIKALTSLVLATCFLSSQTQAQELTGDARTACEVILCLSTGNRPTECAAPVAKYFSIKAKYAADTLIKRRNFLNLCPAASVDTSMKSLVDLIVKYDPDKCTAASLNKQQDLKYQPEGKRPHKRTIAKLPPECSLVFHEYTNITLPQYTCSGEFYTAKEWANGVKFDERGRNMTKVEKECWK